MVGMPAYQRHWFHRLAALPAAVLCMAVVFIHIKDQGPIIGYALSRGPGLPSYADDRRNWTETIGVISLVVEGSLLVIAVLALYTATRSGSRRELSRASA
jgi:hypothetical protein